MFRDVQQLSNRSLIRHSWAIHLLFAIDPVLFKTILLYHSLPLSFSHYLFVSLSLSLICFLLSTSHPHTLNLHLRIEPIFPTNDYPNYLFTDAKMMSAKQFMLVTLYAIWLTKVAKWRHQRKQKAKEPKKKKP